MDIDDLIYPLLADSFPEYEEGEVLDIVEEFKMPRGLDNPSEFEQEVWQKYLSLKSLYSATGDGGGAARTRTHDATEELGGSGREAEPEPEEATAEGGDSLR